MASDYFTLEVGGTYLTQSGIELTILAMVNSLGQRKIQLGDEVLYLSSHNESRYTRQGKRKRQFSLTPTPDDSVVKLISPIQLTVNEIYKTQSGKLVTILSSSIVSETYVDSDFHTLQYHGSDGIYYNRFGEGILGKESSADILAFDPIVVVCSEEEKQQFRPNLEVSVGKSFHKENGQLVTIIDVLDEYFLGSDSNLYDARGSAVPSMVNGVFSKPTNLSFEYGSRPPWIDPIDVLNTLPDFSEIVEAVRKRLKQGGHCGESTGDKIARQRYESAVDDVCNAILKK
jgi:hypothetical protein